MKIKLFTIPNFITLANLICGVLATREVIVNQDYTLAFWLVIIAAVFDFFDGLVARLLSQQSAIGVQLDSLADLISFGLTPSFALFSLASTAAKGENISFLENIFPYLTLIVVAFSALRLAKFNIDDSQHDNFVGLPTPASAILCMSVAMLCDSMGVDVAQWCFVALAVVVAVLMVSSIDMFSLKFKSLGWRENMLRYIFLGVVIVELGVFRLYAIPLAIITYILISIAVSLFAPRSEA